MRPRNEKEKSPRCNTRTWEELHRVRQEPIWAGLTQWSGADADGKAILNGVSTALASSPSPMQTVSQGLPEAEFPRLLNRLRKPSFQSLRFSPSPRSLYECWSRHFCCTSLHLFQVLFTVGVGGRYLGCNCTMDLRRGLAVLLCPLQLLHSACHRSASSWALQRALHKVPKITLLSGNSSFRAHHCVCLGKGLGCLPVYITLYL